MKIIRSHNNRLHNGRNEGAAFVEALATILIISGGMYSNLRLLTEAALGLQNNFYIQRAQYINASLNDVLSHLPAQAINIDLSLTEKKCTGAVNCTPAEIATYALHTWRSEVTSNFPNGTTQISSSPNGGGQILELNIAWHYGDPRHAKNYLSRIALAP